VLGVIAPLVLAARQTGRAVIVAVGCTAGHDRSVGIAEVLANRLPAIDFAMEVSVRHRDLHHRGGRDPISPARR
jgi:RNase adaptor protein for sRNA GlmZ degradation